MHNYKGWTLWLYTTNKEIDRVQYTFNCMVTTYPIFLYILVYYTFLSPDDFSTDNSNSTLRHTTSKVEPCHTYSHQLLICYSSQYATHLPWNVPGLLQCYQWDRTTREGIWEGYFPTAQIWLTFHRQAGGGYGVSIPATTYAAYNNSHAFCWHLYFILNIISSS